MSLHRCPLSELLQRLAPELAAARLHDTIQYPRLVDMHFGEAKLKIEQPALDLTAAREAVAQSTELRSCRFADDVLAVLDWLAPSAETLGLPHFDGLVVAKHGLLLLHVKIADRSSGRVACVDVGHAKGAVIEAVTTAGSHGLVFQLGMIVLGLIGTVGMLRMMAAA